MAEARFLKIDDVPGDAHHQGRPDWIQLLQVGHIRMGNPGEVSIVILSGQAAETLYAALRSKRVFKKARIEVVQDRHVLPIDLENVQVTAIGHVPRTMIAEQKGPIPAPFTLAFGVKPG